MVPTCEILVLPVQVLKAVFSTFPKPTFDLAIPDATLASVTAPSASFIVVIPPS
jgi:hypothetical protein